jgi:hypothetical protein
VLFDELLHVLGLVAGSVISEEDDLFRIAPLGILEEVGEVELVLPAPPLWVGVEDEPVPLLGPEERDECVPSLVCSETDDRGSYYRIVFMRPKKVLRALLILRATLLTPFARLLD